MKTYIKWSAKEIDGQYGKFLNVSLNAEDIMQYVNDRGYINLTISPRKEVGQFGDTHSIILNEWKKGAKEEFNDSKYETKTHEEIMKEDIPF